MKRYPVTTLTFAALLICCTLVPAGAGAEKPAIPPRKTEALYELQNRLDDEQKKQQDLKKKSAAAEAELEESRKALVALAKTQQETEANLSRLERNITVLQEEQNALTTRLEADYGSIGNLVLALQRIRRMPTETLVIRPGAPLETAQSAMLLQSILPAINARATQLATDLDRLNTIAETLDHDRIAAQKSAADLKAQYSEMQILIDRREKLFRQTRTAYDAQAETVARIAAEAETLAQLVSRLAAEEEAQRAAETARTPETTARKPRVKPPALPGGAWKIPVSGNIATHFGEKDDIGATAQGMKFTTRPGAVVTAPAGGIVRFAGPFRNYGNMVIIEHDKDFHSLIGGLSRADLAVGRKISAGEPVGTMPGSGAGPSPRLYYELRHKGKPVDPAAKFPDLGEKGPV